MLKELQYRLNHDTLTGINNREYFERKCPTYLNGSKHLNNSYSNEIGGLVLREIAGRIQSLLGKMVLSLVLEGINS